MNTLRAQASNMHLIIGVGLGLIAWIYFAGAQISYWLALGIEQNNMTGLEALIFHNFNVFLFLALLILLVVAMSVGGGD